jgi:hypothetical protein
VFCFVWSFEWLSANDEQQHQILFCYRLIFMLNQIPYVLYYMLHVINKWFDIDPVGLVQTHSFIWGPYAAEHGMVLIWKYSIEDSMFTAICIPLFGIDQNCTVYWCKYWVALNPGLGSVGSNMHSHYCPWTSQIKPSLQCFHICRVRWLSKFHFHLFYSHYLVYLSKC